MGRLQRLLSHASYAAKASRAVLQDPYEGVERIRERLSEHTSQRKPRHRYEPEREWLDELDHAWRSLGSHGAVVVDDIDYNRGFGVFTDRLAGVRTFVAPHADAQRLFGIILKDPVAAPAAAS